MNKEHFNRGLLISLLIILVVFATSCQTQEDEVEISSGEISIGEITSETPTEIIPSSTPTSTRTPIPTPTDTQTVTPTPSPTPFGGADGIVFATYDFSEFKRCGRNCPSLGIYIYYPDSDTFERIAEEGFTLEDISPDGSHILVSEEAALYTLSLVDNNLTLLAENFDGRSNLDRALWSLDGQTVVYIGDDDDNLFLFMIDITTGNVGKLTSEPRGIIWIYRPITTAEIYWEEGYFRSSWKTSRTGTFSLSFADNVIVESGIQFPSFTNDGTNAAFSYQESSCTSSLIIQDTNDQSTIQVLPLAEDFEVPDQFSNSRDVLSKIWSSNGEDLLFEMFDCLTFREYQYRYSLETGSIEWLENLGPTRYYAMWSPDDRYLVYLDSSGTGNGFRPELIFYDFTSEELIIPDLGLAERGEAPQYRFYWIPVGE